MYLRLNDFVVFSVLVISTDIDPEFTDHRITVEVVVRSVMRPMTVKGESKVGNLEVARCGYEKVVGLDVAMNKLQAMSFFDSQHYFCNVETSNVLAENVMPDQQAQKVTTRHVFHD